MSGDGQAEWAWDDVKGCELDLKEVRKARLEEIEYMKRRGLWKVVPRSQADGKRITSVKWVGTDKDSPDRR